jgi:hypothetical protein
LSAKQEDGRKITKSQRTGNPTTIFAGAQCRQIDLPQDSIHRMPTADKPDF